MKYTSLCGICKALSPPRQDGAGKSGPFERALDPGHVEGLSGKIGTHTIFGGELEDVGKRSFMLVPYECNGFY
jgi:hypothetical protein